MVLFTGEGQSGYKGSGIIGKKKLTDVGYRLGECINDEDASSSSRKKFHLHSRCENLALEGCIVNQE